MVTRARGGVKCGKLTAIDVETCARCGALAGQFLLNRHTGFPGTPPTCTPGITPVDVATCTATPIDCR